MSRRVEHKTAEETDKADRGGPAGGHVVIAGFGRVGRTVAELLTARGVPYIALGQDPSLVAQCREQGLPVFYGDASRAEVMTAVGVGRARAVAITLDKPKPTARAVGALRRGYPKIPVVVRGRDLADLGRLEEAGATAVVPEALEGSLQLGATVLRIAGAEHEEVEQTLEQFRADDYGRLKDLQNSAGEKSSGG